MPNALEEVTTSRISTRAFNTDKLLWLVLDKAPISKAITGFSYTSEINFASELPMMDDKLYTRNMQTDVVNAISACTLCAVRTTTTIELVEE